MESGSGIIKKLNFSVLCNKAIVCIIDKTEL